MTNFDADKIVDSKNLWDNKNNTLLSWKTVNAETKIYHVLYMDVQWDYYFPWECLSSL